MQEFLDSLDSKILTLVTFLPVAGAALLCAVPRGRLAVIRSLATGISVSTLILSLYLWWRFDTASFAFQYVVDLAWIPSAGIGYRMGLDGISLLLVLLSTFLTPLAMLASWSISHRVREYFVFMLLLEAGMIGVFVALDFFLFYFFWEVMLVPMYFLIGIWGGERRIYAATKFVLYTMAGSVLMLIAIFTLYLLHGDATGDYTFAYLPILDALSSGALTLEPGVEFWLFLAFLAAFAIKVPLFPLHTWLPDAHVEAPTAGSVLLAGVLLKMGAYGLVRFSLPLFPSASAELAPLVAALAIAGIIYGALVAMVQPDMKKLVAYSSVSHLGFVVLGIFGFTVTGLEGSIYQMIGHGVSTGALFLLVGILYDRRHTRLISDYGGVAHRMPVYAAFFLLVALSSIGLPGLNGFVGEFLILLGTFLVRPAWAILAAIGIILSAVYMLWMYQRTFFGRIGHPENETLRDLSGRELAILIPLAALILWMGIYPATFLRPMDASVTNLVDRVSERLGPFELDARGPEPMAFPRGLP